MHHKFVVEMLIAFVVGLIIGELIGYFFGNQHRRAIRAKLFFEGDFMPLSLAVGKTATAVLTEFDAAGNVVPAVQPPVYTSDNTAVATVSGNQITAVSQGTANITGTDPGDTLSASDSLTVTDVAVSAKLSLSAN